MKTHFMSGQKRFHIIRSLSFLLLGVIAFASAPARIGHSAISQKDRVSTSTKEKDRKPTEVEVRFEFNPRGPFADLTEYYSVFMVIKQNGDVRALRYGLHFQARNVAAYEGVLPEAEIKRLFDRVSAAFSGAKYRKDYQRHLVYEDNGFYLAIKSDTGKIKEMFGGDGPRPDELRALLAEMGEWWKKLSEVPPAYAYLTRNPIEKDRLKLLRQKYKVNLTPIESLPADLQALLIPVVTQPLSFYPLTQPQYEQLKTGMLAMTYKGKGYELTLIPSAKETKLNN